MSNDLQRWNDRVMQQMAAEAYFEGADLLNDAAIRNALRQGNNRPGFEPRGFSRFADVQGREFVAKYQVIHQASDDPTVARTGPVYYAGTDILANTGMSATLIQKRGTNEYTLAIRSTEFRTVADGGDRDRDLTGADVTGIFANGFALAQLTALEDYYAWLKESGTLPFGAVLNVTGYSLGGHLATVFTEIHASDSDVSLRETITFNGAGRGTWTGADSPAAIVAYYRDVLADPTVAANWATQVGITPSERAVYDLARAAANGGVPLDPLSIYSDPRHAWAQYAARLQFQLQFSPLDLGSSDLRNGAAGKITQIYGKEMSPEWTGVANSGVHGPAIGVFVEAQPLLELPVLNGGGATDFGNGHAIVLLADSLAVMRAYQTLDPDVSLETMNRLFAAWSNRYAQSLPTVTTEDDPLENALDALRRLFLGSDVEATSFRPGAQGFGDFDSRNQFHDNLEQLMTSARFVEWAGQTHIVDMTPLTAAELLEMARLDIAYRYALKELNPFALLDAQSLYDMHNAQGALEIYDPQASVRNGLTDSYLADRAAMLAFLVTANANNTKAFPSNQVTDQVRYLDLRQRADGTSADVLVFLPGGTPNFTGPNTRIVAFGSERDDVLQGRDNVDHLYGGNGLDFLRGGAENDYLEGGAGLDVYVYNAASGALGSSHDGADMILDSDGRGVLRYVHRQGTLFATTTTTVITDASVKISDTEWSSADGRFAYALVPGDAGQSNLIVTIGGNADSRITLKDFRNGDFGITLNQPVQRTFADTTGTILGADLSESLAGTPDSDLVLTYAGSDTVHAGAGDDKVEGGDGADELFGEEGGDRLYGEAGRDSLYGGGGNDELYGGADPDIVEGGDGADLAAGGSGSDVVVGGGGDDEVHSGDKAPLATALLLAETESPTGTRGEWVDGGEGDDTVVAGPGNDQVMGDGGADLLVGGAGDDNLIGDSGRTLVHIDNWLVSRQVITSGNSTNYQLVYNGEAQIAESANGAADLIYGGAGADWVFAGAGSDFVDAGSGDDVVFGEAGADALAGGTGNDVLIGDNPGVVAESAEGGDYLDGGDGDDQLWGGGGDDVLVGGAGRDTLIGGVGKDLYVLEKGGGEDVIFDVASSPDDPEASVLVLGEGIAREAIKFRTGSLLVDLGDGDRVHVEGFNSSNPAATPVLGAIHFADGTSMSYADVLAQGFDIDGTEEDDDAHDPAHPQLLGTAVTDRIRGFGGNDQLFGFAGNDVLSGGAGNDMLVGGEGDDAYAFTRGDGQDVIFEEDATAANLDRVEFAAGIGPDDIDATRDPVYAGNLVLTVRGSTDGLTIANQFVAPEFQVEQIRFADDTVWTPETTPLLIRGTAENNSLSGTAGPDVFEGLAGDDTLSGGAGNDTYRVSRADGQDTITDNDSTAGNVDRILYAADLQPSEVRVTRSGTDLVLKLAGTSDQITVSNYLQNDGATPFSIEQIRFPFDGTVWDVNAVKQMLLLPTSGPDALIGYASDDVLTGLAGNDTLVGNAGNDTLDGGTGNDLLQGGLGDDSYLIARGDGQDTLTDFDGAAGNIDRVVYAPDILPSAVSPARSGNDLVLSLSGSADRVTLTNYFENDGASAYAVERIEFQSNATVWDLSAVRSMIGGPTEGDDTILGSAAGDALLGLGGNDVLRGGGGNDTLDAGSGNDTLYGEGGSDTYLFQRGSGQDAIVNAQLDSSGTTDVLQFSAGIAPAEVIRSKSGNDLLLAITGTTDTVRLRDYFLGDLAIVEEIRFAGGTVWTEQSIAGSFPVSGTSGNDLLQGTGLSENINGLAGADTIYGSGGNDTIDGGTGTDWLYGGFGDDLLKAGTGDSRNAGVFNYLYGGPGNDILVASNKRDAFYGEGGNDIYIGGTDADWMEDTGGNNLYFGGAGLDSVWLGDQNDIAMGFDSADGDRDMNGIRGRDVLLINKTETGSAVRLGAGSTISLGGGTLYKDLSLQANNNLLALKYGNKSMNLGDWYGDAYTPPSRAVSFLQIVIEGTRDYNAASSNPMNNRKVQVFDFTGLVSAFDAARAAGQSFSVAANLPRFWLWSSDTVAIGGAAAYQYARTGTLGTLSHEQLRALIADSAFAVTAQPIIAPAGAAVTAEGVALEDSGAVTVPTTLAAATGTSKPADLSRSDATAAVPGATWSTVAVPDLPQAWFAPRAPQESATSVAAAWQRIARDLPAHLERDGAWDGAAPFSNGVRVSPADAFGVRVTFDSGVGLNDAAAGRLRPFEGLKEGFALLS